MKERLDNNEQKLNEIELNHSRPIPLIRKVQGNGKVKRDDIYGGLFF